MSDIKVTKVSETEKVKETKQAEFIVTDENGCQFKVTVILAITVTPLKG